MAVAHSSASESHTGTTGSTSQASFSWTHTQTGTPQGVVVFVHTFLSATDNITSVVYGSVTLTRITGGAAIDTAGEAGRTDLFFSGSGLPTGNQTITVNRVNNTTALYASAATVTAAANTTVVGIALDQNDGGLAEVSISDDGATASSLRYAGGYSGLNAPPTAGANSTLLTSIDIGNYGAAMVRETTAGTGSRLVGFSGAADDRAVVYLAVRELVNATMLADTASFNDTFFDAGLLKVYTLPVDSSGVSLSGTDTQLTRSYSLPIATASFGVTANTVNPIAALLLTASTQSVALGASAAGTLRSLLATADSSAFSATPNAAGLVRQYLVSVSQSAGGGPPATNALDLAYAAEPFNDVLVGSLSTASLDLAFDAQPFVGASQAVTGGYILTLTAATLTKGVYVQASGASFTVVAGDVFFSTGYRLTCDSANFTFTGSNANTTKASIVPVSSSSTVLTGTAAVLSLVRYLSGGSGAFTETGQAAGFLRSLISLGDSSAFLLSGLPANLNYGYLLPVTSGSYQATGSAANLPRTLTFPVTTASYTSTATATGLTRQGYLAVSSANVALAGTAANLIRSIPLSGGSFTLGGSNANFVIGSGQLLIADKASFALTFNPAAVDLGARVLSISTANVALSVKSAQLFASVLLPAVRVRYEAGYNDALVGANLRVSVSTAGVSLDGQAVSYQRQYTAFFDSAAVVTQVPDTPLIRILRDTFIGDTYSYQGSPVSLFKGYYLLASGGAVLATATNPNLYLSALLSAASASFAFTPAVAGLLRALLLTGDSAAFALTLAALGFLGSPQNALAGGATTPLPATYGGSDSTQSSFLRPRYVEFNSPLKARDLGTASNLLTIVTGNIGGQSGTNTIYFRVETDGPAQLRITKNALSRYTDRSLSVGILDADRKPLPLTATGYTYTNDIINTSSDESTDNLPQGTYYFTLSSDDWRSIPYSITIQIFRYVSITGAAGGALSPYGRFASARLFGTASLTAPLTGKIPASSTIEQPTAVATGQLVTTLQLSIMRGTAGGTLSPYGHLKQTFRIDGSATLGNTNVATLTSSPPYGGGY